MAKQVFISYSRKDSSYVQKLVTYLRDRGVDVWIDTNVDYGERWTAVIREHVKACGAFVPVMSPRAEGSEWVELEIMLARSTDRMIMPILLEGRPFFTLANRHCEDVTDGRMPGEDFVSRLLALADATPAQLVDLPPGVAAAHRHDGFAHVRAYADAAGDAARTNPYLEILGAVAPLSTPAAVAPLPLDLLPSLADPRAADLLYSIAQDSTRWSWLHRFAAIAQLATFRYPRAVDLLAAFATDDANPLNVRALAAQKLTRFDRERGLQMLEALTANGDFFDRLHAVEKLAKTDRPRGLAAFDRIALNTPPWRILRRLALAISRRQLGLKSTRHRNPTA